jgi:GNAT superfamily N-acetyltransferase
MSETAGHHASTVIVRRASPEDLSALASVHVATWKSAYRGIVPDDALDGLTVERDLASGFGRSLLAKDPRVAYFAAEAPPTRIVGFAVGGPVRDPEPAYDCELRALYVLPEAQRKGVGRALVRDVVCFHIDHGRSRMLVWVMEDNPYRRFYEKLGGVPVRRRLYTGELSGVPLSNVAYGWSDLQKLATILAAPDDGSPP